MDKFIVSQYGWGPHAVKLNGRKGRMLVQVSKKFAEYLNRLAKKNNLKCTASVEFLTREQFENDVCGGSYMYHEDGKYPALFITFENGVRKYADHHIGWMFYYFAKEPITNEAQFESFLVKMLLTYDNNFDLQ